MKNKYFLLPLLSFVLLCSALSLLTAQGPEYLASCDKNKITIGDRINYSLELTLPDGYTLKNSTVPAELGQWSVKDYRSFPDTVNKQKLHLNYELTTYTTGQSLIPGIQIFYFDDKNKEYSLTTEPYKIEVESVMDKMGDAGDILDIRPPVSFRITVGEVFLWLIIILSLCAGGYFVYRRFYLKKPLIPEKPPAPPVPPYQIALSSLDRLLASGLIEQGKIKEYYIELTDIIRDYLSGVYGITARDRTTAEIFAALKKEEHDKKILTQIKEFFDECDLVKFAKYRPDETICRKAWEDAKNIVKI